MKLQLCSVVLAATCVTAPATFGQAAWNTGTWATALVAAPAGSVGKADETYRQIVHVSLGSTQFMAITLTNELGTEPLTIGAVTVAHRTAGSTVEGSTPVTFAGKPNVVIPPGKAVTSDQVPFAFSALSDVAVSIFVPAQPLTMITVHNFADATNYIAAGDQTASPMLDTPRETASWRFLKRLEVNTTDAGSIVCYGDSITDGSKSTKDTNQRWPDLLAARLGAPKTGSFGVLNEGIGGNRILHDVTGPSAIERFDRDVLDHPHVRYLIILEGINDIGHAYDPKRVYDVVSADELIAADKLLITRAHANGIKVIGATLTPYGTAKYMSPKGETVRQALNNWIRTSKDFDGVIDFDKATRDPANPSVFLPAYDSGDHLHPNDAGMHGMADSIDLKLFTK